MVVFLTKAYIEETVRSLIHRRISIVEYIRGYDIDGNEKLWIVTSGKVNSLAFVDFNSDGKNEVSKNRHKNQMEMLFYVVCIFWSCFPDCLRM